MTKKTLAERFEVLEQEYNSVMSTKYMGTSAFSHRSGEYIDSAKGNNWIARAKSYLKTVMERNLITTKILMIHKGLQGFRQCRAEYTLRWSQTDRRQPILSALPMHHAGFSIQPSHLQLPLRAGRSTRCSGAGDQCGCAVKHTLHAGGVVTSSQIGRNS